jgi:soluble lytic murein transglycosylase-like protein
MWRKVTTLGTMAGLVVAGAAAGRIHVVRRGETLSAIGRQYQVSVAALAAANGLPDPDRILAGATLTIPESPGPATPEPADSARPATPPTGALRDTVVPMPPAELAADRSAARIAVPAERAGLRVAFLRFSRLAGVPSDLAMALAWQESGWQRSQVSPTGAVGVMQLEPATVDFVSTYLLGLAKPLDPRDPVANIRMGTRFLRYLLDSQNGDVDLALASYYQGLRSVREHGPLDETDRFVANVKALRGRL